MVATPLVSQLVDEIGTKFQRLPHVFGVQQLNGSSLDAVRPNRKSEIQHGGPKSAVLISQLVDETGTKFQRLNPYFWVQQVNASSLNAV